MAEWQDIASAPKDGTPILGASEVIDGNISPWHM
jgi:hypothetical protein